MNKQDSQKDESEIIEIKAPNLRVPNQQMDAQPMLVLHS